MKNLIIGLLVLVSMSSNAERCRISLHNNTSYNSIMALFNHKHLRNSLISTSKISSFLLNPDYGIKEIIVTQPTGGKDIFGENLFQTSLALELYEKEGALIYTTGPELEHATAVGKIVQKLNELRCN